MSTLADLRRVQSKFKGWSIIPLLSITVATNCESGISKIACRQSGVRILTSTESTCELPCSPRNVLSDTKSQKNGSPGITPPIILSAPLLVLTVFVPSWLVNIMHPPPPDLWITSLQYWIRTKYICCNHSMLNGNVRILAWNESTSPSYFSKLGRFI